MVIFVKCPSAEGTHLNLSYVVKIAPEYSFKGGFLDITVLQLLQKYIWKNPFLKEKKQVMSDTDRKTLKMINDSVVPECQVIRLKVK